MSQILDFFAQLAETRLLSPRGSRAQLVGVMHCALIIHFARPLSFPLGWRGESRVVAFFPVTPDRSRRTDRVLRSERVGWIPRLRSE
jgi:hypothetical protein